MNLGKCRHPSRYSRSISSRRHVRSTSTTVSGIIDLYVDAASERQTEGDLIIEVISVESQQTVYRRVLTRSQNLSEPFLISSLPEIPLELSAYIDRDLDGQFIPCTQNGQDLYESNRVPFTLSPSETITLNPLRLEGQNCHANTLSRIAGQVSITPPGERRESGRPIYLTIHDDTQETTETIRIVDEHLMAVTPRRFDVNLAPGSYRFFAFVDLSPTRFSHHANMIPSETAHHQTPGRSNSAPMSSSMSVHWLSID